LQQFAREFEANLIRDLPERMSFRAQVSVQGSAVHREETGNRGGGTGVPEQFDPQHTAQIFGEGASTMGRVVRIRTAGRWLLHASFSFLSALALPDPGHGP